MMASKSLTLVTGVVPFACFALLSSEAWGQATGDGNAVSRSAGPAGMSLRDRPTLLDGPGSPKETLRQYGLDLDLSLTQFYQGLVAGDGSEEWQYGGKVDLVARLNGDKLGLWPGFSVNVHHEIVYGKNVNNLGDGSLLPINTALTFPENGTMGSDTSLSLTQTLGARVSLSFGKFNMLDAASRTPLLGGGGIDTFQNVNLAAPVSGLVPPYIFGGSIALKTAPAAISLFAYDPRSAQNRTGFEDAFADGVTTMMNVTVPITLAGRTGYQGFKGIYSTKEGTNLSDVPELLLPPEAAGAVATKQRFVLFRLLFPTVPRAERHATARRLGRVRAGRIVGR